MKALACRRGNLTLVGRQHAAIFEIIAGSEIYPLNKLSERDRELADQLHRWDLLELAGSGPNVGYRAVEQTPPNS